MILKKLAELEGDEILARDIMTWDYQIILPEGAKLRKDYIEKLSDLGIAEVFIKEKEIKTAEIAILKSEIEESVKETVKDVLERHTYHNNEELKNLSEAADNIISTILEEEKVVETIFDIKQRSADIYEHSISICSLAILTAIKLNVELSKIHDIGVGCLLHDIGLRYITVNYIDRNPDDMNRQDVVEYKKHPIYGYSSIKEEKWISELSKEIILCHHEKLDGSGFPLRRKDLSLECRIVNVCDTFDEMICGIGCRRVKVHEAIEYLKNCRNVLFDAEVVDVFLGFTAVYPAGTKVLTNEGELAVVVAQNKEFQERPIIRILKDKNGNPVKGEMIKDLLKIHNLFIEKIVE